MQGRGSLTRPWPMPLPAPMARAAASLVCVWLLFFCPASGFSQEPPGFTEDFQSLENWEPLHFPKIKEHTAYSLGHEGGVTFLVANSSASASAMVLGREIDVYETPLITWRWRAMDIYEKADLRTKKGDDAPLRVYVMFRYDPGRAGTGMRVKYAIAKALYGQYPPHASLNYLWASRAAEGDMFESAYTGRSMMIVMRSGSKGLGQWVEEEANILEDYRRAFGQEPPQKARIAVMSDSDNTGEAALSFIDYISAGPVPEGDQ